MESFMTALCRCALEGELTEEMVRTWIDPEEHELALKVVRATHLHRPSPEKKLLREIAAWARGPSWRAQEFRKQWGEQLAPYEVDENDTPSETAEGGR